MLFLFRDRPNITKPDDGINKNHATEYFWYCDNTFMKRSIATVCFAHRGISPSIWDASLIQFIKLMAYFFREVGRWCRWCAGVASWRGICRTWLPMKLMVGWRDSILDCLFHWQSVSFFVLDRFFVSLWYLRFAFTTLLLQGLSDLDDYSVDLRIIALTVLVIILPSADTNFTYWSDVWWEVQVEKSEAQGG